MPDVPDVRYRLIRRLAQGGMAEIFEAKAVGQGGFERRVAIKRIRPEFQTDERFGRMFLDEARIASRLHHHNVVAVLDYGVMDGIPFQTLEYVAGQDARRLHRLGEERGQPMPVEVALHICIEVARGLAHAHAATDESGVPHGIVHRDVSPGNILVSWDGAVKLSDFGIAIAHDRAEQTQTGVTKGKASYMAPEQMLGGKLDRRADIFSLGCVLHTLVAGHSPLSGEDALRDLFTDGSLKLNPSLPEDIVSLLRRALHRDRAARFADAGEMADAMDRILTARSRGAARTTLRQWLRGLRAESGPGPKGALHEFFDLDLVCASSDGREQVFETQTPSTMADPGGRPKALAEQPSEPEHRGFWQKLGLVAAVLVGLSSVGAAVGVGLSTDGPIGSPTSTSPSTTTTTATSDGGAVGGSAIEALDAGVPPLPNDSGPRAVDVRPRARAAGRRDAGESPAPAAPGRILVRGPFGYAVFVDGNYLASVPRWVRLTPNRRHVIEVRRGRRGETVARREVSVEPDERLSEWVVQEENLAASHQ